MARLKPEDREPQILTAAVVASEKYGYAHMTREQVAKEAGCTPGLVSRYFGTMNQLRRAVVRNSIKTENLTILAQALAANDAHAKKADDDLKKRAIATLI